MKKLNVPTIVTVCVIALASLSINNIYCQSGVGTLTDRETIAKIKELNKACDLTPGCIADSYDLRCKKGKCTQKNIFAKIQKGGDLCNYVVDVYIDKFDKNGNPVCCHKSYNWGPVHCQ